MNQHNAPTAALESQNPKAISGTQRPAIVGQRHKELDATTAAMLESQEIPAIQGDGEWWCPNPTCEIIEK